MIFEKFSSSAISQRTVTGAAPSATLPNRPVCTSRVQSTTDSCVGEPLATPSAKGLLSNRGWGWLLALRGSHSGARRGGGQLQKIAAGVSGGVHDVDPEGP